MRFHSQNIKKEDRTKDWIHWRAWLYFGKRSKSNVELVVPSKFWHIELDLCKNGWQEEAIGLSFACPLFAVWFGLDNSWLYNLLEPITKRVGQKYTHGRNIGISFHDSTLWINLWSDQMESRTLDPWWWDFNIKFDDLLLGKPSYSNEVTSEGDCKISMPEGQYDAHYKIETSTWKRPRWFKKVREYIEFNIPIGIPHEGKGENSWDCGMDATFGISEEWRGSVHAAAKKVAMRCLKERQKYGSLSSPEYAKWREERIKKLNQQP